MIERLTELIRAVADVTPSQILAWCLFVVVLAFVYLMVK